MSRGVDGKLVLRKMSKKSRTSYNHSTFAVGDSLRPRCIICESFSARKIEKKLPAAGEKLSQRSRSFK